MIDQSAISQGDALRAEIAAKMAAYEAMNGPVETTPILTTDKRIPYRISCPEKKQQQLSVMQTKERSRKKLNEERIKIAASNRERIKALSNCKLSIKAIAERTGLSASLVQRVVRDIRNEQ